MTLVDANVWVALAVSVHEHHQRAFDWFESITGQQEALFCRATLHSFLRLITTEAMFSRYELPPLTNTQAWKFYSGLLGDSRVAFAIEPDSIERAWRRFAAVGTPSPKLWMDAYLAGFAFTAGYQLVTFDRGFRRFDGLRLLVLS